MKRIVIISLHLGYWLVYFFLTVSTLIIAGNNFKGDVYASIGLNTFLAVTCFYIFYFFLVPHFLAYRRIGKFMLTAVITAFSSAAIVVAIHLLRNPGAIIESQTYSLPVIVNWSLVVVSHTIIGTIHGALATFMKGFFSWYEDIHVKQVLEKKNLETQMSLLKAQIDPHFLFNTLNNIDVLIKNDSTLASIYLQKLCSIMRFTLYENHAEIIPLAKEIQILTEYIELEKIRSTKKFMTLEVTGEFHGISIAPMVLLSFVENAIKHSDGRKIENAITIKIEIDNESAIIFCCKNVIGRKNKAATGGIGIDLIRNRLNLLYPKRHNLVIGEKDGYFEVNLKIFSR